MGPELGFGLIILSIGALLFLHKLWFLRKAIKTIGIVVEVSAGSEGGGGHGPMGGSPTVKRVQFQAQDGHDFTFNAIGIAVVGSRVSLLYDRHNPQNARINSFLQLWSFALGWAVFGILISLVAVST